jgi:hypothetical protein
VGHLNKSRSKAEHRSLGSIDIINSVRSVMCLGRAEGLADDVTAVAHMKANFIKCGRTQLYRLNERDGFSWLGESGVTPDDIMNFSGARSACEEEVFETVGKSKIEEAADFLHDLLLDSGEIPAAEAIELADEAGISKRTLERARQESDIKSQKIDGRWLWFM